MNKQLTQLHYRTPSSEATYKLHTDNRLKVPAGGLTSPICGFDTFLKTRQNLQKGKENDVDKITLHFEYGLFAHKYRSAATTHEPETRTSYRDISQ